MRAEFAKLCHEVVQSDSKSVVMIGDISHEINSKYASV